MRTLALFALLTAFAPWAAGQRAGSASAAHAAGPVRSGGRANGTRSFVFGHGAPPFYGLGRRSSRAPYSSLPFAFFSSPFFGDSFDSDDLYSTGYPVAADLPPFLLQAARSLGGPSDSPGLDMISRNTRESQSSEPLMIELQGGRYVRVNDAAIDGAARPLNFGSSSQSTGSQPDRAAASAESYDLAPAVLVFRDGHREEVRDYTIADGILYARGDYYTDGYWNKTIALAKLNVQETVSASNARGVKFVLPSAANEVVTRP